MTQQPKPIICRLFGHKPKSFIIKYTGKGFDGYFEGYNIKELNNFLSNGEYAIRCKNCGEKL